MGMFRASVIAGMSVKQSAAAWVSAAALPFWAAAAA